jgi:hypothetical protein
MGRPLNKRFFGTLGIDADPNLPIRADDDDAVAVVNHFQNFGYSILAKKNTDSSTEVIKWEIYW